MLDPMIGPYCRTLSDPNQTRQTSWTLVWTFCSTYLLLTHSFHIILRPHSGLCLSPDIHSTLLYHPVYPSVLLTLFVFTRLHVFPCTRLQPDLLFGPAPLVYKSALLYARSSVLISHQPIYSVLMVLWTQSSLLLILALDHLLDLWLCLCSDSDFVLDLSPLRLTLLL